MLSSIIAGLAAKAAAPLVKYLAAAACIAALVVGVLIYRGHVYDAGAQAERDQAAAVAAAHEAVILHNNAAVDRKVAQTPHPQDMLLKEWSRP